MIILDDQISFYVSKESLENCKAECPTIQSKQSVKIGIIEGQQYNGLTYGTSGGNTQEKYEEIVMVYNNLYYRFKIYQLKTNIHYDTTTVEGSIPDKELVLFNQILSTFRFD